jgi:hypothetical protein
MKPDRDQRKFQYAIGENQNPLLNPGMELDVTNAGSQPSAHPDLPVRGNESAVPEFGMVDPELEVTMFDS